jgi:hypothetical protein
MRRLALIALVVAAATGVIREAHSQTAPPGTSPVVTKVLTLFDQLRAAEASKARGVYRHVAFQLSDSEVNDYMRSSLKTAPRPGLESMTVKIFPNNYISTFTVVDFDAVERWHPGTIPTLLKHVLTGKKSIWVDYRIHAQDSKFSFSVEKAYYQNVRMPAYFVEKMIQIVGERQPEKYDTSQPMSIPFGLRQLSTSDHVIQGQT